MDLKNIYPLKNIKKHEEITKFEKLLMLQITDVEYTSNPWILFSH